MRFFVKDYHKEKILQYSTDEFIGCLIQHIPERYFHMVYYYGIFANRSKSKYISLINALHPTKRFYPRIPKNFNTRRYFLTGNDPFICECGGHFHKHAIHIPGFKPTYFDNG